MVWFNVGRKWPAFKWFRLLDIINHSSWLSCDLHQVRIRLAFPLIFVIKDSGLNCTHRLVILSKVHTHTHTHTHKFSRIQYMTTIWNFIGFKNLREMLSRNLKSRSRNYILLRIHKMYSTLYDSATGTRVPTDVLCSVLHSKHGISAELGSSSFSSSTSNVI
jgi:hypothetical protein